MRYRIILTVAILIFILSSCGSPFAEIALAPENALEITSPNDLPFSLREKVLPWYGRLLKLNGDVVLPYDAKGFIRVSNDGNKMTYKTEPIVIGENGLPTIKDTEITIYDILHNEEDVLVSKNLAFPYADTFFTPTFSPDSKSVIFVVSQDNGTDLVKVDLESNLLASLDTNVVITNFGHPDISADGSIVVVCSNRSNSTPASELCLLDGSGKFIRYLTNEGYPWPGYGCFTPDGQSVVYESRFKLYKVNLDGTEKKEIAPCSALFGPQLVTQDYAVTACYISQNPDCYALFLANLDGTDFRRIGYIEPYCVPKE
jgi:hypothetical protein